MVYRFSCLCALLVVRPVKTFWLHDHDLILVEEMMATDTKTYILQRPTGTSINRLVVEYIVATDVNRARLPDHAVVSLIKFRA